MKGYARGRLPQAGLPHLGFEKRGPSEPGRLAPVWARRAAAQRERTGSQVLGVAAIRRQQPHGRPKRSKKSPAPLFHTFSKTVREELYEGYAWFVAAYR
jgi:hypothetical protein